MYTKASSAAGAGTFTTYGDNGNSNVQLTSLGANADNGYVAVMNSAENLRVAAFVDSDNDGHIDVFENGGDRTLQLTNNASAAGFIGAYGDNGNLNVLITSATTGGANAGKVSVYDGSGNQQVLAYVNGTGHGILEADSIYADAPSVALTSNPDDPSTDIYYSSITGPEVTAFVRGTAALVNGSVTIDLPRHFSSVVVSQGMTVQVTPHSAASLGLAVTERSTGRIVVKELDNGSGNYDFDYYVMAVKRGAEDFQVIRRARETAEQLESQTENTKEIGQPTEAASMTDSR
jgi:hypothetical protein